ncbi:helicase-related protein [Nocardiopsis flavescens]|uniref:helicase-related protein n=1 Tax=Nocardiopsis flavescens TaxID=758803 RepID=UPI00093524FE|nr:helicase-related protein [Nocardiopsis flavescens]
MIDNAVYQPDRRSVRNDLTDALRLQLVGPLSGPDEILADPPDRRYLMGTLYPQESNLCEHVLEASADDHENGVDDPAGEESAFAESRVEDSDQWLPSSVGLSLFTDAQTLRITCRAARYRTDRTEKGRRWARIPLPETMLEMGPDQNEHPLWEGRAIVRVRRRPHAGARLLTITLVNGHTQDASRSGIGKSVRSDWEHMLFQVELHVEPVDGTLLEYPGVRLNSSDPEEEELRLQYRHVLTYAVGHGCAVHEEWGDPPPHDGPPPRIRTEIMPTEEVPRVGHGGDNGSPALHLSWASSTDTDPRELQRELLGFVGHYQEWYEEQTRQAGLLPAWADQPKARILGRVRRAVERMEEGVRDLCTDPHALSAFRLANQAMELQMRHSEKERAGEKRHRDEPLPPEADPGKVRSWRPFQLGFFLLTVSGLIDTDKPDRETVDLIWFPTGGGKTEAYLLLSCFEMVLRRLRHGARGGGTAVVSRYTLSLLTTQQFQRAATSVCALEFLRLHPQERCEQGLDLGEESFSLGLWTGMATTPNTYQAADEKAQDLRSSAAPDDVFILDRCPWCGTRIVPERKSFDPGDYGLRTTPSSFSFRCPRQDCSFHKELPVRVIDDHLYEQPPTLLLGTVDKFARLAWEPYAGRLFGFDPPGGEERLRPSLILQDELHLLTGPLGTTVGLYESAVIELCAWDGVPPKIIASTATIRRSQEQVRRLYGRSVQLFPPSGLDARHSHFAKVDPVSPGRLYVGVMAQGHPAGRATVSTAAAVLHTVNKLPEAHRDDYWTLVAYHHSLRELGRTLSAARDDIPALLKGMSSDDEGVRELPEASIQELTSNLDRRDQPRVLARLEQSWPSASAISFLACTNMLSVGVDVSRLALMLMLGQPKAAAEYIQATSRVGRSRVPGLVVAFFNSNKPRDRSHYEGFGVFHRSLYRHVEPATVTPWSLPSRRRALHAVLAILVRHGHDAAAPTGAGLVSERPEAVEDAARRVLSWVRRSDPSAYLATESDLHDLITDWRTEAATAAASGGLLYWNGSGRNRHHLLTGFGTDKGLWPTLNSVRSVDFECQLKVEGPR